MKKILSKFIFWIMGWEVIGSLNYPKKCIVIAAPHTSNWDFLIGRCYGYICGITPKYLIKSSFFVPVLGAFFKWNGGIPVYRNKKQNVVEQLEERFNSTDDLILGIAPPILIMEQHIFNIKNRNQEVLKKLLQKNRDIIHGAFVLDETGQKVIFRDTLQIENLDLNELEASLNSLSLLLSEFSEQIINFSKY